MSKIVFPNKPPIPIIQQILFMGIFMSEIIFPDLPPIKIVPQPNGKYSWVSNDSNSFTEFSVPKKLYDTQYFLAHNTKAGSHLNEIKIGDVIKFRESNAGLGEHTERKVKEIRKFKALQPTNLKTPLVDLSTGKQYSVEDITKEMWTNNKQVVFQTCIEKEGDINWGRLFVIAE